MESQGESETDFSNSASSYEELINSNKNLNVDNEKFKQKLKEISGDDNLTFETIFQELLNDVQKLFNLNRPFIYSPTGKHFKLPYTFNKSINDIFGENGKYGKYFSLKYEGGGKSTKIKVWLKNLDGTIHKGMLFETGNGSISKDDIKKIKTEEQERGTVLVWNKFAEQWKENNFGNFLSDENIKEIVINYS